MQFEAMCQYLNVLRSDKTEDEKLHQTSTCKSHAKERWTPVSKISTSTFPSTSKGQLFLNMKTRSWKWTPLRRVNHRSYRPLLSLVSDRFWFVESTRSSIAELSLVFMFHKSADRCFVCSTIVLAWITGHGWFYGESVRQLRVVRLGSTRLISIH